VTAAPHLIRDFAFDVTFSSEAEAFEQHERLSSFVSERLVAVADEIFDKVALADGEIVRIDSLAIDLGAIAAATYYDEAERLFRQKLEEALRAKLAELASSKAGPGQSESIVGEADHELDLLARFLENGYLPWNGRPLATGGLDGLMSRVIAARGSDLAALMRGSPDKVRVARRLAWQTSGTARDALTALLTEAGHEDALLEAAFIRGDATALDPFWPALLRNHPALVERTLRRHGARAEARKAMARGLPDPVLTGLATLLQPDSASLVAEVTGRPAIFREAAKDRKESWPETRARLWEFALAYLLAAGKSRFDQRAYLSSTIRHMAGHYNIGYRHLIDSLVAALKKLEAPSAPRTRMLALLADLGKEGPARGETRAKENIPARLVERALIGGDSAVLQPRWASLLRHDPDLLERLIRRHGVREEIRMAMARGLSDAMLADIAGLLEPDARGFVEEVTGRPPIFREAIGALPPTEPAVRQQLWDFTLAYLLAERGSHFNRRAYLAAAVRKMAAHYNQGYGVLLDSLINVLERMKAASGTHIRMAALLTELRGQTPESETARPPPAPELDVTEALIHGDEKTLSRLWPELRQESPSLLASIVRRHGARDTVRRAMARGLPDSRLLEIVVLLAPEAAAPIEELIGLSEVFRAAFERQKRHWPKTRVHLWECTLIHLMTERDGAFDRRAYLASVVRQLAERSGADYRDMRDWLAAALIKDGKANAAGARLLASLTDIRDSDSCAATTPDHWADFIELALTRGDAALIEELWPALMRDGRALAERLLRRFGAAPATCLAIAETFPKFMLHDIAELLEPTEIGLITDVTGNHQAFRVAAAAGKDSPGLDRLRWAFTLTYLLEERGSAFNRRSYLASFIRRMAAHHNMRYEDLLISINGALEGAAQADLLRETLVSLVEGLPERNPATAEQKPAARPPVKAAPVEKRESPRHPAPAISRPTGTEADHQHIYVGNAGLVLATPYLPLLFQMTDLISEGRFRDAEATQRALHLLQYVTDETAERSPEHLLPLNKILCGLEPDWPAQRNIDLSDAEKETAEELIRTMIAHWRVIGNTSPRGLRESFLQREGRLSLANDAWHLLVQPRTFDMLLDALPWSFGVIRHPWMTRVLYVEWR